MPDVHFSSYPHGLPVKTARFPDGTRLSYRVSEGGDTPIILLHGYPLSSALWEKAQILFPSQYRSFALDLRGFGDSDKTVNGYSAGELAEDIAQFMRSQKIRQAVLVGHSSGGSIAQHFAVNYPERVLALVLVNGRVHQHSPSELGAAAPAIMDSLETVSQREKVIRELIAGYADATNVTPEDMGRILEMGMMADPNALKSMMQLVPSAAISTEKYSLLKMPALLVVGAHDPYDSFSHAVALSDVMPKSRIAVMTRCSHIPMWEKPIGFVKTVTEFLSQNGLK